jgi:hypothetical protein
VICVQFWLVECWQKEKNEAGERGRTKFMAGITAMNFELYWQKEVEALRMAYKKVMATHHLEVKKAMERVHEVLSDIASLAGCTPREVGESKEWVSIVEKSEAGRINLFELLEGETLFSALYGVYSLAFVQLKKVLQNSKEKENKAGIAGPSPKPAEGLKVQKRKRRSSTHRTGQARCSQETGRKRTTSSKDNSNAKSISTIHSYKELFRASNGPRDGRSDNKQGRRG